MGGQTHPFKKGTGDWGTSLKFIYGGGGSHKIQLWWQGVAAKYNYGGVKQNSGPPPPPIIF